DFHVTGVQTCALPIWGRRGAYVHHDAIGKRLRARRAARLAAITSGGAIPDNFDYDVILEPTETRVGSVHEDFAIESMQGDIFQRSEERRVGKERGARQ